MTTTFIPDKIQCFWCNGLMEAKGPAHSGQSIHDISYFCRNCGAITYHAVHRELKITGFEIDFRYREEPKQGEF